MMKMNDIAGIELPPELTDDERHAILRRHGFEPDAVIEAYKKDVDRTLIRENLKLTAQQRLDKLAAMLSFAAELQRAMRVTKNGKTSG